MAKGLLICTEGFFFELDGAATFVGKNAIAREGHRVISGHESYFKPLVVDFEVDDEPKNEGPVGSSVRADTRGARSR